jgi:outer membrane protein assembly factor BamE
MRIRLIVLSLMLASCSYITTLPGLSHITPHKIEVQQGNLITPEMRSQLKVGMTRLMVRSIVGTPLIDDPFHSDRWDYVYRMEQNGKLVAQQRMVLYFKGDTLERIDDSAMPPMPEASATDGAEPK